MKIRLNETEQKAVRRLGDDIAEGDMFFSEGQTKKVTFVISNITEPLGKTGWRRFKCYRIVEHKDTGHVESSFDNVDYFSLMSCRRIG